MSIRLFPHNECAYRSAVDMMGDCGRAAIVHPTGTGKSFIAFRLVEDNPSARFLWISPSEYIFRTQMENICAENADFPAKNLTFATYAKLMLLDHAALDELSPDYIILDEFHRCGAEQWGGGVDRLLVRFPEAKILGLSATAIRYLDNNRNMANELFHGNVASEMTLGEALVRGILPTPAYVSTLFRYQNELQKYQKRIDSLCAKGTRELNQKYLDALRRALDKADGLDVIFQKYLTEKSGKYIVFCANVEHMQEMVANVPEWFSGVDTNPNIYAVYSDSTESGCEFEQFKADNSEHLKLLFCIDMLNEGVHVSGISGVILFRPTVSPIIYKQQIGRALTAGVDGVPLIIDVVNNFDSIRSIDSLKDEMANAALWLRSNGRGEEIVTESFDIIEQLRDCRELFETLDASLGSNWEQYFQAAKEYSAAHGGSLLSLPRRYVTEGGLSLGDWIMTQRRVRSGRQNGTLSEEQINRLDSIGMVWENRLELKFQRGYEYAKNYYEQHGNLCVPVRYITEDGFRLGAWISNLRKRGANKELQGVLTQKRIDQLNSIGMCWDAVSYTWEKNYLEALAYFNSYGDLNVPFSYRTQSGFALGTWLNGLRLAREQKNGRVKLTDDQIRRLDAIGMRWGKMYDDKWMRGYEAAKRYAKHNDLRSIPVGYQTPDGFRLGRWVSRQQYTYDHPENGRRLSQERIHLLKEIHALREKESPWQRNYSIAERYYHQHGTLDIGQGVVFEGAWIGKWLAQQRKARNAGKLNELQIQQLNQLGFDWRTMAERKWQQRCEEARAYFQLHGNLNVPAKNQNLYNWIRKQKQMMETGTMPPEQRKQYEMLFRTQL